MQLFQDEEIDTGDIVGLKYGSKMTVVQLHHVVILHQENPDGETKG